MATGLFNKFNKKNRKGKPYDIIRYHRFLKSAMNRSNLYNINRVFLF